jgi:hypothetical protein
MPSEDPRNPQSGKQVEVKDLQPGQVINYPYRFFGETIHEERKIAELNLCQDEAGPYALVEFTDPRYDGEALTCLLDNRVALEAGR